MIKKFVILVLVLVFSLSFGQQTSEPKKNYFLVQYTTGALWNADKQAHEQAYFREHSQHIASLRKKNQIHLGGRFDDTGMIILQAENAEVAAEIISQDPAVINETFHAKISEFYPFYNGCVD